MNKQCTGCVVSAGTHKPAEALHKQIDEPKSEALRLADECDESATHWVHEIETRLNAAKMLRAQHARIAELEKDAARLLYATKDYDGFVHVKRDKYDFALECMEEAGRSEPTIEDELNGVRRLIDAAIAAQAKHGGA